MTQTRSFPELAVSNLSDTLRRLPFVRPLPQAPDYPAIAAVQSYWDGLRGRRTAPARAEIDPRPLAEALDVLFVAELVAPGVARLRLCGQHFSDLLGMEPRGMPLSVFFAPAARGDLAAALAQVAQGVRATLPVRSDKALGRPGVDGMLALMPLADQQGAITRILGVLETHGQIGRTPRHFRLMAPVSTQQPAPRPQGTPVLTLIQGGRD
ncbi:MAG: PAS domain-containing protein [Rhodobacteraceae bacterium]|jgi:hypothetical protein|nr:PAS domain-containing protein [Paracoccaceae bacterium]